MKYVIRGILAVCIAFISIFVASGQVSVDSYGQYINADKSIERVVTFKNKGYVYVEGQTIGQGYEAFFPEGPNEQRNGTQPFLVNIWIAIHIREILTKENSACFHYYIVGVDKLSEYKCAGKKQVSTSIDSLPANIIKDLSEFRDRVKVIWPGVKFPDK